MTSHREREHIFERLRSGVVPERGLEAFAVGIERQRAEIGRLLDLAKAGEGVFKFLRGGYGCGKTFCARLAILDAAAAGKHILCEKPMCMNLVEAEQIAEAVGDAIDRDVTAENVQQLIGEKLIPLGLVPKADGSVVRPAGAGQSPLQVNMKMAMVPPSISHGLGKALSPLYWPPVLVVVLAVAWYDARRQVLLAQIGACPPIDDGGDSN